MNVDRNHSKTKDAQTIHVSDNRSSIGSKLNEAGNFQYSGLAAGLWTPVCRF